MCGMVQISHTEAVTVIKKCPYWMQSTSYQPSQVKTSDEWTLFKEEEERAKDISQFMKKSILFADWAE